MYERGWPDCSRVFGGEERQQAGLPACRAAPLINENGERRETRNQLFHLH